MKTGIYKQVICQFRFIKLVSSSTSWQLTANLLLFTWTMQHFVCTFVNLWHHLSVRVQFIVTVPIESCQKQVLTFHHIPKSSVSLGLCVPKSERIQTQIFVWKVSFFLCHQTSQNFQSPLPFHSQNFKFYLIFSFNYLSPSVGKQWLFHECYWLLLCIAHQV